MANINDSHDHPCVKIGDKYHITTSATKTVCGLDWKYLPNQERFRRTQEINRLRFLAPKEINCEECKKEYEKL